MSLQGSRMSIPYFVNPRLNYIFQGPEKKYPPLSGFDLLAKTGNAYDARKNDAQKNWQKQAYTNAYERENQDKAASSAEQSVGPRTFVAS